VLLNARQILIFLETQPQEPVYLLAHQLTMQIMSQGLA
jgi:hypothetical protein